MASPRVPLSKRSRCPKCGEFVHYLDTDNAVERMDSFKNEHPHCYAELTGKWNKLMQIGQDRRNAPSPEPEAKRQPREDRSQAGHNKIV